MTAAFVWNSLVSTGAAIERLTRSMYAIAVIARTNVATSQRLRVLNMSCSSLHVRVHWGSPQPKQARAVQVVAPRGRRAGEPASRRFGGTGWRSGRAASRGISRWGTDIAASGPLGTMGAGRAAASDIPRHDPPSTPLWKTCTAKYELLHVNFPQ
jgi:hypothetical protein